METKTKGQKLFIVLIIAAAFVAMLCFTGCNTSCFGCNVGCEKEDMGCVSGLGYISEGCASTDSCITTVDCVDYEKPYNGKSDKVLLVSCETVEEGCFGNSGCYNGLFVSGCGTCGVFYGEESGFDVDETTIGCMKGCAACDDTDGMWEKLLDKIYNILDMG